VNGRELPPGENPPELRSGRLLADSLERCTSKPFVGTRSIFLRASLREPKPGRAPGSASAVLRICSMRVPSSSA
jgi:hypothetical protein